MSGLLVYLSFPKIDISPLAFVALIPLLVFLYDKGKWTAFKAGFFFGWTHCKIVDLRTTLTYDYRKRP
ncbi:MAG: hypothetical protein M1443_07340 [Nitrospirae bacterium]|nr:hypothetical protein [Nitrospirota bacterium]